MRALKSIVAVIAYWLLGRLAEAAGLSWEE